MCRRATAAVGTVAVLICLLTSAVAARSPAAAAPGHVGRQQTSPQQARGILADGGGEDRNGNGKSGGNGKSSDGKNSDGKTTGQPTGKNSGPGAIDPGAVQDSVAAARQRALTKALADVKRLNGRVGAELARLLGLTGAAATSTPSPAAAASKAPTGGSAGAATAAEASAGPNRLSAAGGVAAPRVIPGPTSGPTPAHTPASSAHRGGQPIALQFAPASDYAVTAIFGFLVLGALWTVWLASLRPVLGRRAPTRQGAHRR